MKEEFKIGDMVTVWLGGLDYKMKNQIQDRVGLIIESGVCAETKKRKHTVHFGDFSEEFLDHRLRKVL